jgi:hypothetical protein
MRRLWVWLWLAVLVGQLSSLIMVRRFMSPVEAVHSAAEPGLVGLARETAAAWEEIEGLTPDVPELPAGNTLLAREEWLLRIRDAEQAALARGIEVRLSEELQAWMRSPSLGPVASEDGGQLIAYLTDIDRWLGRFVDQNGSVATERLFLQPDSRSSYPALQFELHGPADELATFLHGQVRRCPRWEVGELDLSRQSAGEGWWLRGSCVFRSRDSE